MIEEPVSVVSALQKRVAAVAAAAGPSEVFRNLLEGSRLGAPRAAIFLLRERRFKGWGCLGYAPEAASRLTELALPVGTGWLGRVARATTDTYETRGAGETDPDFGQPPAAETVGLSVRLGGNAAALLLAERNPAESPWDPGLLVLLVSVARLRLELDLAWRRLRASAPEREASKPASASPSQIDRAQTTTVDPPRDHEEAGLAVFTDPRREDPKSQHMDEARRFAKLVATDVRLYNEEAVALGRQHGDLVDRLWVHLQRGRESFLRRFPDLETEEGLALLHDAYVQVLAGGDPALLRLAKDLSRSS